MVGRNGAGKTSTLRCLAGIVPLDSGRAECGGRVVSLLELGAGLRPRLLRPREHLPERRAARLDASRRSKSRPKPAPSSSSVTTRPPHAARPESQRDDPGEAAQRRGLAGAVAPDDADRLARLNPQRTRRRAPARGGGPAAAAPRQSSLSVRPAVGAHGERRATRARARFAGRGSHDHRQLGCSAPEQRPPARAPAPAAEHVEPGAGRRRRARVQHVAHAVMNGATGFAHSSRSPTHVCVDAGHVVGRKKIGVRKNHGSSAAARIGATSRKYACSTETISASPSTNAKSSDDDAAAAAAAPGRASRAPRASTGAHEREHRRGTSRAGPSPRRPGSSRAGTAPCGSAPPGRSSDGAAPSSAWREEHPHDEPHQQEQRVVGDPPATLRHPNIRCRRPSARAG